MNAVNNRPDIILDHEFLPKHEELFAELMSSVNWDASMKARKTASFGKPYDYSQMSYAATEIPACLVNVVEYLKLRLNILFNNCLLNLYETGQNTMGFHSDDVHNLVPGTGVAIVSLGSERIITFRSMDQSQLVDFRLSPGSMLYMDSDVQKDWMHAIRKQGDAGPRISLTWRAICSEWMS
ncbi:MAG: alpha-ketoglutarate-dependent dioxygenase AlkB [Planctomycetaceae bacterium]|nr:alpha-ketoglutarate-dependent dioxygenase AlkB [Planctomycetaceae bacterium]